MSSKSPSAYPTHLTMPPQPQSFQLLESFLWTKESGYFLLAEHLKRLENSARYFNFPYDAAKVQEILDYAVPEDAGINQPFKVRLLLFKEHDRLWAETENLSETDPQPLKVGWATYPVSSANIFLQHKTTHRTIYEDAKASRPDCDDVLLWNEYGNLTEASRCNVVVAMGDKLFTPPISCGLLAGTFRAYLLAQNKIEIAPISKAELEKSDKIYLINSVRKWRTAIFCEKPHETGEN